MGILSGLGRLLLGRATVVAIGVAAIGVIVWLAGPLLRIGGEAPLASTTARVAAIAAVVVLIVGLEVFRHWRTRRLNRRIIESLARSQSPEDAGGGAADGDMEFLRQRFEEAMAELRKTSASGQGLYDLPWYLVIGPPGAGKTTLLRHSGLRFPLSERLGVEVLAGVGGTRSCDWWLTDQAVLLDTAGRFTAQAVDAPADASTWRGFLDLIRQSRPRQPVNGVIIAVSVADLLVQDEPRRRHAAQAVKARLQEVMRGLGVRAPVYVVLTKLDLLAGFAEFFEDLDDEAREQVWGVTLPIGKSGGGATALAALAGGIDGLLARLDHLVPQRLAEERTSERRRRIYGFPGQLAGMRPLLVAFLDEVFRADRYSIQPLLRGVYFTSGTQGGTPVDRMNVAYAQAFGLDARPPPPHTGPAGVFFIKRLLVDVVIGESGLVGRNRAVERRLLLARLAVYGACALTVAGLGAWWHDGRTRAQVEVRQFDSDFRIIREGVEAFDAHPTQVNALVPLDALRRHLDIVSEPGHGPVAEIVDLFHADGFVGLQKPIGDAYRRLLHRIMLPQVKDRLEEALHGAIRAGADGDPAALADLLTLYLQLGSAERFDRDALERWLESDAEWALSLHPEVRRSEERHLHALLDAWPGPQALDHELVRSARRVLLGVPPVEAIYEALEAEGHRHSGKELGDVVGLEGLRILERRSWSPSEARIPYLYTSEGFHGIFLRELPALSRRQVAHEWVLGADAVAAAERDVSALIDAATRRYIDTYIATWRAFLENIDVRDIRDVRDANEVLAVLSGPRSPIVRLLEFVVDNTDLGLPEGARGADPGSGTAGSGASSPGTPGVSPTRGAPGEAVAAGTAPAPGGPAAGAAPDGARAPVRWPGTPIGEAFSGVRSLLRGSNGQPPGYADVRQEIIAAYGEINALDTASDPGKSSFDTVRQRLRDETRNDALSRLETIAVSQSAPLHRILADLPPRLRSVMLSEARGYLDAVWRREVAGECTRAILNRYPVYREGREEITVVDFGSFFGPGGTLERFQTTYLSDFIDVSGRSWQNRVLWEDGLDLSPRVLGALRNAAVVRSTFFRGGTPAPSVRFTLTPTYLDSKVVRIVIDAGSQVLSYRHEPPRAFNLVWPDPDAGREVTVIMTDVNGASASIRTGGQWAWFRMFDRLSLRATGPSDKFAVPIMIRGLKAEFEMYADSTTNPFELPELSRFRCEPGLA